jgi:hypothetical protein
MGSDLNLIRTPHGRCGRGPRRLAGGHRGCGSSWGVPAQTTSIRTTRDDQQQSHHAIEERSVAPITPTAATVSTCDTRLVVTGEGFVGMHPRQEAPGTPKYPGPAQKSSQWRRAHSFTESSRASPAVGSSSRRRAAATLRSVPETVACYEVNAFSLSLSLSESICLKLSMIDASVFTELDALSSFTMASSFGLSSGAAVCRTSNTA